MTLTRCADLSAADWLTDSHQPWDQLVTFGPGGFPAYARLRFIPDPAFAGQTENDVESEDDALPEAAQLRRLLQGLARYTRTPDDCYFCLWEGWGQQLPRSDQAWTHDTRIPAVDAVPGVDPSFSRPQPLAPMVVVPHRAYVLFNGALSQLGDWGSTTAGASRPSAFVPDPAFIWPADRAWCVANDVDPHWAGFGADTAAIDQLVTDPRLDIVRADPDAQQPQYR